MWFCLAFLPPEVVQSRSAEIGPFTVIGIGTKIGSNTKISNSVVGEGCTIGSNISIEGSYLWNNVTIEDDCKLMHAIVCDGVVMKSGTVLEPGVVLSFKVCAYVTLHSPFLNCHIIILLGLLSCWTASQTTCHQLN